MQPLLNKIKNKTVKIGIIGLGYVGLPLAVLLAEKGFFVTGFVRNPKKAESLKKGKSNLADTVLDKKLTAVLKSKNIQIAVTDKKILQQQEILIVCVPTPVTENKKPDLTDLIGVMKHLQELDLSEKLIINESTVAPFTTREILGSLPGTYFLVSSPERVDPGNTAKTVANIPKVIGGINEESTQLAKALYSQIIEEEVVTVNSLEAAEMAKILENTYRAVNIALINEFAQLAEKCNVDILEVIKAAKTKWSFHPHYPGIGVGGHCMPVDPYYLLELAEKRNVKMDVVLHALQVNGYMPQHMAQKIIDIYKKGMVVLIYGITYKKNINDMRESPVMDLCNILQKEKIPFHVYDPYISSEKLQSMGLKEGKVTKADILVVGTDHASLLQHAQDIIGDDTIIIDGRNFFTEKKGKKVLGVGRTLL